MKRLIDADAFKQRMYTDKGFQIDEYGNTHTNVNALNIALERSAIDAEPVRHGKWTITPSHIECSECGESFMLFPSNYCPNCGARMDKDE